MYVHLRKHLVICIKQLRAKLSLQPLLSSCLSRARSYEARHSQDCSGCYTKSHTYCTTFIISELIELHTNGEMTLKLPASKLTVSSPTDLYIHRFVSTLIVRRTRFVTQHRSLLVHACHFHNYLPTWWIQSSRLNSKWSVAALSLRRCAATSPDREPFV